MFKRGFVALDPLFEDLVARAKAELAESMTMVIAVIVR